MRVETNGVQHQQIEAVELCQRFRGNVADIGDIGGAAGKGASEGGQIETVGQHRQPAVQDVERLDIQPEEGEGRGDAMKREARFAAALLRLREDVAVDAANIV